MDAKVVSIFNVQIVLSDDDAYVCTPPKLLSTTCSRFQIGTKIQRSCTTSTEILDIKYHEQWLAQVHQKPRSKATLISFINEFMHLHVLKNYGNYNDKTQTSCGVRNGTIHESK